MNSDRWTPEQIFVYRHPVDMRKQIDGLANIVSGQLYRDPSDRALYLFINRGRDKIKLLIWHLNGYWLLYKRLERQRFQWPRTGLATTALSYLQNNSITYSMAITSTA